MPEATRKLLVVARCGHRQKLQERVLDQRNAEEGRILHEMRLDAREGTKLVAVAQRGDSLVPRGDGLGHLQEVEREVVGERDAVADAHGAPAQQPLAQR
eukprot:3178888-Prymnesium_polylepis.1